MKNEITSEEKLLNLIRKKTNLDGPGAKKKGKASTAPMPQRRATDRPKPSWDLVDFLNAFLRVLVVAAVLLTVYLGYSFYVFKDRRNVADLPEEPDNAARVSADDMDFSMGQPFKAYVDVFQKRDIFASSAAKATPQAAATNEPQVSAVNVAEDFKKEFKIVGIILDKDPKAVIENLKDQTTLFLSKGERAGDGEVLEIQAGKVIFLIRGQKIELMP